MTVIVFFEDFGLALSDIMLSKNVIGDSIPLPSLNHSTVVQSPVPTRLVRKIISFRAGNGVGKFLFSGTVSHVEELYKSIKLLLGGDVPDEYVGRINQHSATSVITIACDMTEKSGYKEFEILGISESNFYARQFDAGRLVQVLPYFGRVSLSGSGAPLLFKWLLERGEQLDASALKDDPFKIKRFRILNYVPSMLLEEDRRVSSGTIKNGFGGYYEMYSCGQGAVDPIDGIITLFLRSTNRNKKMKFSIERIFFQKYVNESLLLLTYGGGAIVNMRDGFKIPLSNFKMSCISPLMPEVGGGNAWSLQKLILGLNSPFVTRVSMYVGEDGVGINQIKRFATSEYKLFDVRVIRQNVFFKINMDKVPDLFPRLSLRPSSHDYVVYST